MAQNDINHIHLEVYFIVAGTERFEVVADQLDAYVTNIHGGHTIMIYNLLLRRSNQ